jgi:hypothetical protein
MISYHQGRSNALQLMEYLAVYFVHAVDKEFYDEWFFIYCDESFHMPMSPSEWRRYGKIGRIGHKW